MKITEVWVESKPNLAFQGHAIGMKAILEDGDDPGEAIERLSRQTMQQALLHLGVEPRDLANAQKALGQQVALEAKKKIADMIILGDARNE